MTENLIQEIPLASLMIDPANCRGNYDPESEDIQMLAASMAELGQRQPIQVKKIKAKDGIAWGIIDGGRRFTAAQLLKHNYIKAVVVSPERARTVSLASNITQRPMTFGEKLTALREIWIQKAGKAEMKVAARALGFDDRRAAQILGMVQLPKKAIDLAFDGLMSEETLSALVKFNVPGYTKRLEDYLDKFEERIECDGDYWDRPGVANVVLASADNNVYGMMLRRSSAVFDTTDLEVLDDLFGDDHEDPLVADPADFLKRQLAATKTEAVAQAAKYGLKARAAKRTEAMILPDVFKQAVKMSWPQGLPEIGYHVAEEQQKTITDQRWVVVYDLNHVQQPVMQLRPLGELLEDAAKELDRIAKEHMDQLSEKPKYDKVNGTTNYTGKVLSDDWTELRRLHAASTFKTKETQAVVATLLLQAVLRWEPLETGALQYNYRYVRSLPALQRARNEAFDWLWEMLEGTDVGLERDIMFSIAQFDQRKMVKLLAEDPALATGIMAVCVMLLPTELSCYLVDNPKVNASDRLKDHAEREAAIRSYRTGVTLKGLAKAMKLDAAEVGLRPAILREKIINSGKPFPFLKVHQE